MDQVESLVVLEDGIEWVKVDGIESGEAGGEAEAAELILGALPPLCPVGGHDEDVVLEQRPGVLVSVSSGTTGSQAMTYVFFLRLFDCDDP